MHRVSQEAPEKKPAPSKERLKTAARLAGIARALKIGWDYLKDLMQ